MKIASRRDNFFRVIIFGAIFICLVPMAMVYLNDGFTIQYLIGLVVITSVAGLLVWVWHGTYYILNKDTVKYKSGPFKGSLEVQNIEKIIINKTGYVGLKYGLARKGIIIESSSHPQLYISPTNPQEFVRKLIDINPDILIST